MKTRDLIKLLEKNGWTFKRSGSNQDIYLKDGERESIVNTGKPTKTLQRRSSSEEG